MEVMIAVMVIAIGMGGILGAIGTLHRQRGTTDDLRRAREIGELILHSIQAMDWDVLNDRTEVTASLSWSRPLLCYRDQANAAVLCEGNVAHTLDGTVYPPTFMSDAADPGLPEERRIRIGDGQYLVNTGLPGLQVYLEYYRMSAARDITAVTAYPISENRESPGTGLEVRPADGGIFSTYYLDPSDSTWKWSDRLDQPRYDSGTWAASDDPAVLPVPDLETLRGASGVARFQLPDNQAIASQSGVRLGPEDGVGIRIIVSWLDRQRQASPGRREPRMYLVLLSGRKR
jgi:hypothetical protein